MILIIILPAPPRILSKDDDFDVVLYVYLVNHDDCDNDDDALTLLTPRSIITFTNVIIDKTKNEFIDAIYNICNINNYISTTTTNTTNYNLQ